jgi:hypothetical protein
VPDPWQVTVLISPAPTILLNCGRQVGKSTIIALLIVRELLNPDAMVVIVSPSERQSKELMRKVLAFWRKLGKPIPALAASKISLELVNGARLEAFPASSDTVRGISAVTLLVADEAAMTPDDLYHSMAPMLAVSGGRQVALSSPKGQRGWWYGLWETPAEDDPDIGRIRVPSALCPRISAAFLARERRRWGDWWYGQEYECVFQEKETAAFRAEDVDAAFAGAVPFDTDLFAS